MNAFKTALLGASILIAASAAASAADVYQREGGFKDEPSYPAITSWAGFYAGIHAGATFGDEVDVSIDDGGSFVDDVDSAFVGGIHVGYNWQRNSPLVLGVEASIGLIGDEDSEGDDLTSYLASLRGRIGYGTDDLLVYGTGGVAFLGFDDDDVDTAVGFVVGGGVERKLTSNVSIGLEGLYYDFSATDFEGGGDVGEVERNFWTVQARLNYHFNSGYDAPLK